MDILIYVTLVATITPLVVSTDVISSSGTDCFKVCQDRSAMCRKQADKNVSAKILCYAREDKCITKCEKKKEDRLFRWLKVCYKTCKVLFKQDKKIKVVCKKDCDRLGTFKKWFGMKKVILWNLL